MLEDNAPVVIRLIISLTNHQWPMVTEKCEAYDQENSFSGLLV